MKMENGFSDLMAFRKKMKKSRKQIKVLKMLQQDIMNTELQTKNSLIHFPLPTSITDENGNVIYYAEYDENGDLVKEETYD